jgi:pimeloyl-ACP methyl ester carboxylesterase
VDQLGIQSVVWVGYSMGGSLAAWLTAAYPEITQKAFLLAPSGYIGGLGHTGFYGFILSHRGLHGLAYWFAKTDIYPHIFPESAALQALGITDSYGVKWVEKIGKISAPVMLGWSESDRISRSDTALLVQKSIKNSTLKWFPRFVGHDLLQADSTNIAEDICRFIHS